MKRVIPILFITVLLVSCSKSSDPAPASNGDFGSWSYGGDTYKGTFTSWTSNVLAAVADKPHTSSFQAYFNSPNPAAGTYTVVSGSNAIGANQVSIAMVDSVLPAISYMSPDNNPGTVTVSRSGSSITVTATNVKVKGITAKLVADSTMITGTIKK